jgi:hypothetical protein
MKLKRINQLVLNCSEYTIMMSNVIENSGILSIIQEYY